MRVALVLLTYAALLAVLAPLVLPRSAWVLRAPALAIAVWLALCASVALSLLLAGLALTTEPGPGLAGAVPARAVALAGAAMALLALVRGGWSVASAATRARRQRRRHAEAVAVLGRPLPELDAVVVDHDAPAAWCLPGRDRAIVVTTGALRVLDATQLRAVVAHERAHLRGRHHLVLVAADAIARSFPLLPLCRHAGLEIAGLVEMLADDTAARSHGRAVLATALVGVADVGVRPSTALAAGGPSAVRRMRRMLVPPRPLCLPSRAAAVGGMAAVLVFPPCVACVPLAVLLYLAGRALPLT
jgi:Zn-dependent protease with chaperone function